MASVVLSQRSMPSTAGVAPVPASSDMSMLRFGSPLVGKSLLEPGFTRNGEFAACVSAVQTGPLSAATASAPPALTRNSTVPGCGSASSLSSSTTSRLASAGEITPGAEALITAVCGPSTRSSSTALTAKVALVEPAGISTVAGTVAADESLLARVTVSAAAVLPVRVTVPVTPSPLSETLVGSMSRVSVVGPTPPSASRTTMALTLALSAEALKSMSMALVLPKAEGSTVPGTVKTIGSSMLPFVCARMSKSSSTSCPSTLTSKTRAPSAD